MSFVVNDHSAHMDGDGRAPLRLFVVDDDAGIRTLLEVAVSLDPRFALAGTAATAADTLAFLRETWANHPVDVVLLDVTLPDADGIEALMSIRETAPGARIALFTGWSDNETLARARRAGADAFFPKDGDPQRLLDNLAELASTPVH